LGRVDKKFAEGVKARIEHLVAASELRHAPDADTARWAAGLPSKLHDKLSAIGLVPKRCTATLAAFLDRHLASRTDLKGATLDIYRQARRSLIAYFGEDRELRSVTAGDAKEWRRWLLERGGHRGGPLGSNTVAMRVSRAKAFFAAAVEKELIDRNPFAGLSGNVRGNPARQRFITRDEIEAVLSACPDAEWRLIFALSRFGGLRCPSEHMALRWSDIDWERGRITVSSPKTERIEGKEYRVTPIFPELRPYLEAAFDRAEPGAEFVLVRRANRNVRASLHGYAKRIIRRAGLAPWPRVFHNLRSSRQSELEAKFPTHVVCGWLGNSPAVAREHYLQITDVDFERAASEPTGAVRKAVQQPAGTARSRSHAEDTRENAAQETRTDAVGCERRRGVSALVELGPPVPGVLPFHPHPQHAPE
ncbi:MAG TPA: site-specific integrase, partial [Planctomycetaceae bacterium]